MYVKLPKYHEAIKKTQLGQNVLFVFSDVLQFGLSILPCKPW